VLPAQHIRQYTYAFAAIEPKTGEMVSLMLPLVNTEAMNLHLAEIARRYPDEPIALVLDGAGWHKGENLVVPDNMTLVFLPPYSPELNPVEQLWKALRQNWFANLLFNSMSSLENKLVDILRWVENNPKWVKAFAGYDWILSVI
jgi:transposase